MLRIQFYVTNNNSFYVFKISSILQFILFAFQIKTNEKWIVRQQFLFSGELVYHICHKYENQLYVFKLNVCANFTNRQKLIADAQQTIVWKKILDYVWSAHMLILFLQVWGVGVFAIQIHRKSQNWIIIFWIYIIEKNIRFGTHSAKKSWNLMEL